MTDPIQQHFLGCSIRNFNINLGWSNQATTLNVGLVEDDFLYERFNGFMGELVRFQYDNFIFDGVLSNIRETKSDSGNRLWEVVISDPRDLLAGVQMIIGGYTGFTYGVPNLYNIYGYLESSGYGNSRLNSAGIPWRIIRDAFTQLNQITPIYLAGTPYLVDLSNLPDVPNDYRISSTNISLLDFIQEICSLANHDFTVLLIGNYITLVTISRNIRQLNGSIYNFLGQLPEFINMESGFELQYNIANKFLVGGQVEQIYYQFDYDNVSGTPYADTITRYWGQDLFGNVKIPTRIYSSGVSVKTPDNRLIREVNEQFYLDGKPISYPGNSWYTYPTDMDELRCAIESREAWEIFLNAYNLASNNSGSIHYGKFDKLKIPPDTRMSILQVPQIAPFQFNVPAVTSILNLKPKDLAQLERNSQTASNLEQFSQKVYDYVSSFAKEYLDRKFMVRVPFVFAKYEEDGSIKTTLQPTDTGYIEESLLPNAVANHYLPIYSSFISDEKNKLYCYVRFGPYNVVDLDLSEISEEDYYIDGNFLFIKAQLDPDLVFINKANAFSPRAVVTLPGRVKYNDETNNLNLLEIEYLKNFGSGIHPFFPGKTELEVASEQFKYWKRQVGADNFYIDKSRYGLCPEMAAIPLKDNTTTYGPWYTQGMAGLVEFIQDEDLVPWNFGGFHNMNLAGQAMVRDVYVNSMIAEAGSVEVPGAPIFGIAHQITNGGPLITQINVSIGENGVTSTYRMEKWNQDHGKEIRHRIDTFKKLHNLTRDNNRKFAKLFKPNTLDKKFKVGSRAVALDRGARIARRNQPRTTHPIIMSNVFRNASGKISYNVGSVPLYQVPNSLDNENWEYVAGMGMEGLFVPFSTDISSSGMPHFETPTDLGIGNVNDLNPFQQGHNIGMAVCGAGVSGHRSINITDHETESVYRGMALKGPLVIGGWGYDINNNPVPSALTQISGQLPGSGIGVSGLINVSGDVFHPDYLQDISLWKVGPLDCRWDDNRKVWVAGSTIDPYIRDFRTLNVSGVTLFQLERFSQGSGNWVTWFISADCTTI